MKIHHRTIYVFLMSTSLGCQKNDLTPKFSHENQPARSIIDENKCMAFAQVSFGEENMRNYSFIGQNGIEEENILVIEFSLTDGTSEQRLNCSFKPKTS